MTTSQLQILITTAIALDQRIAELDTSLTELKARLIAEAFSRPDDHAETDGGGKSWTAQDAAGNIARVTFPGPALKASIAGDGKGIEKIRAAAGNFFARLFSQAPKYVPVDKFRDEAVALLGAADGKKLIKLCETKSQPRVRPKKSRSEGCKMKLEAAIQIAERVKSALAPYCERIEIAGSVRRRKADVGDIELVCIPRMVQAPGVFFPEYVRAPGFVALVDTWPRTRGDATGKSMQRLLPDGIALDLFTANAGNWRLI